MGWNLESFICASHVFFLTSDCFYNIQFQFCLFLKALSPSQLFIYIDEQKPFPPPS